MIVYILRDENGENQAFAEVSPDYLLLICSEEEFKESSHEEVFRMIDNAIQAKEIQNGHVT